MELQKQVTSLELSKRLKELGVKQESICYWHHTRPFDSAPVSWMLKGTSASEEYEGDLHISAFTVAELGEMLPNGVLSGKTEQGVWTCWMNISSGKEYADTEAEARGFMLAYLLENKLI